MIRIIGAGMSGLLAANMLWRREPVVYERQRSLPHNHSAVLRFRSPRVGEVLGIPFRKVRVLKTTVPWRNPAADAMAYSHKVLGSYRTDRSILPGTEVVDRWIAPPDLVERMARKVDVQYGVDFPFDTEDKVISTIPMGSLQAALGYPRPTVFEHVHGTNLRLKVEKSDAYLSAYVPDPNYPFSRLSVTGDELIVELSHWVGPRLSPDGIKIAAMQACHLLGVNADVDDVQVRTQLYAKILPIAEDVRREFIWWASSLKMRAFSLGRYATWRPGLLIDDQVQDVRLIDGWIDDPWQRYDMDLRERRRA